MSEFTDLRDAFTTARAEDEAAAAALLRARERAAAAQARLDAHRRGSPSGADPTRTKLQRSAKSAMNAAAKAHDARLAARDALRDRLTAFAPLADPRKGVAELSDELPLLLFPLRLETRFKRISTLVARRRLPARGLRVGIGRPLLKTTWELWVRVFPDACLVDTFEEEPSQVELESARRCWQALWRSRDEGGERAAWRNLVASHGVGRARWLRERQTPLNPGDRPAGPPADTLVLALPLDQSVADGTAALLVKLWEGAWRDGGDGAAEEAALVPLASELGDEEQARALWAATRPLGFGDPPPKGVARKDATVVTVAIRFPDEPGARSRSWSRPPVVRLLPERLLCVVQSGGATVEALGEPIPSPLQVGPDPSATTPQLRPLLDSGELEVADELLWTTDFERAVKDGMGFRIPLSEAQWKAGADRVTVVGVRLGDEPKESRARLEELLAHHRDGRSGFALVPQGTPTNNTEQAGTGFTKTQEADAAFDELRDGGELSGPAPPPLERRDGRWLADGLGIDPALLDPVPGAHGVDQLEARALNVALWPATLGYFLDTLMEPLTSDAVSEQARAFFTSYVSGRGPLPALRIGQQPYGIVPSIAFARLRGKGDFGPIRGGEGGVDDAFLARLLELLRRVDGDWTELSQQVTALGAPGADLEQALLEVLGLHPASAEFHYRYAESLDHLANLAGLFGFYELLIQLLLRAALDQPAQALLEQLGLAPNKQRPVILDRYFLGRQGRLLGDIVDDRPLSEAEPVRVWTDDGGNYLDWLGRAGRESLQALRRQEGFLDDRRPTALLYLMLRHALLLGYADAGVRLRRTAGLPDAGVRALRREPPFIHVANAPQTESRWAQLLEPDPSLDPGTPVGELVAKLLGSKPETDQLGEQIKAIERLAQTPTARLERLLAEHVDTCSYRFDAWRTGWLAARLERMRAKRPEGAHLGAFGWLLDVRPSEGRRTPVEPLPDDLAELFQSAGDPLLERDSANGGYVHAPSADQAVTAAVLRAGYLSNAADGNPEPLAVNLSSERVRLAMTTLEGMRNGQRLGALLGYRLERGLHDGHPGIELDRFILPLRTAFPLVANRIRATRVRDDDADAPLVAARNVADGLRLVEHVE
ncbi:MAG TPA: hypothetical protein VLK58_08855, partial [Conexibacter sp.]|nr:hypothetical protein [Conexibacter sp.]